MGPFREVGYDAVSFAVYGRLDALNRTNLEKSSQCRDGRSACPSTTHDFVPQRS